MPDQTLAGSGLAVKIPPLAAAFDAARQAMMAEFAALVFAPGCQRALAESEIAATASAMRQLLALASVPAGSAQGPSLDIFTPMAPRLSRRA